MTNEIMHDVKNALTGIQTCAEVLEYDNLEPNERKEFAQTIMHKIEQIVEMTQDLLEFSYGQQEVLNLEIYSAETFIQDLLSTITPDLMLQNISICTDFHFTGAFQIDVKKMKRVFLNIITNARDAMPDGGTLTITSRFVHDMIQFEFMDTGCGMSPELQAHFLEPLVTEGKPQKRLKAHLICDVFMGS
ncbi:MAG: HAMP domain-containing histidine kinase [bacterium]|nr:HAMP domain-containing histidine kinase [bacterium]